MIKISIVLLFVSALIIAVIYYRFPSSSVLRPLQYVGVERCAGCHATDASGDQYDIWRHSAHARAYMDLTDSAATAYAAENHRPNPAHDPVCLQCHTTAYSAPVKRISPTFSVQEGVTCEQCHGPGSDYSTESAMRDKKVFVKLEGKIGSEKDCLACHAVTLNDTHCPFQVDPFVYQTAVKRIAHPAAAKIN
ncbi:MAG TPA: cytochrome c family protein [Candidatus Kapabacteria bacterium]|nr:cytochrome c family protein [Candidatus Kapabacteria bacterium]